MLTCYHGDLIQIADNTPNKVYVAAPPDQPPACCKKYFLQPFSRGNIWNFQCFVLSGASGIE